MKTGKIGPWSNWLLRLESHQFIMIVNKKTNEYVNLYKKDLKRPEQLNQMILTLDRHKNYEGEK